MQILVQLLGGRTRTLSLDASAVPVSLLKEQIACYEGIPCHEQRLVCASKELSDEAVLSGDDLYFLSLSLRVVGGKGGFGSLLRGAGAKIGQKKTDNFDACRDLNGRRLRHANQEKKLVEWINQAKERDLEKVAQDHIKKVANQHHFDELKFTTDTDSVKGTISTALEKGMDEAKKSGALRSSAHKKRAHDEVEAGTDGPLKRRQVWDEEDIPDLDSEPEFKEKKHKTEHPAPSETTPSPPTTSTATTTTTTSSTSTETCSTTTTTTTSTFSADDGDVPALTFVPRSIPAPEAAPVDLSKYATAQELLEAVGANGLKAELQRLGLLCGGTPADRAARLFLLKTTPLSKLEKKHFAKKK